MTDRTAAELIYKRFSLTPTMLQRIGGVAVLSGNIEFWAEQALWALTSEDPAGKPPSTDGKPITYVIEEIARAGRKSVRLSHLVAIWSKTASPAFRCRNMILHGVTTSFESGSASFVLNPRWAQETRRRPSGDFIATRRTLTLLEDVMTVLLRGIVAVERGAKSEDYIPSASLLRGLRSAHLTAIEIVDLVAALNHEKY